MISENPETGQDGPESAAAISVPTLYYISALSFIRLSCCKSQYPLTLRRQQQRDAEWLFQRLRELELTDLTVNYTLERSSVTLPARRHRIQVWCFFSEYDVGRPPWGWSQRR